MNRRRVFAIVLLTIFILSSILPIVQVAAATTESITLESSLYSAIKQNLTEQNIQATYNDMQHTISISSDEIGKITRLTLSNSNITNISGLEKFSNVTYLDLSSNELTDESDLSILNSLNLNFLDLSSNKICDVSAISKIKEIPTVNLHNQVVDMVVPVNNSIVKNGVYEYTCELPQVVKEFATPLKANWIDSETTNNNLKFTFNADSVQLTVGRRMVVGGTASETYTGLATLKINITDTTNKLAHSEINLYYVVIDENQTAIYLKDKNLYYAVKAQLTKSQTINSDLTNDTNVKNLYDNAYDKQQILVISKDNLVNRISSLVLDQKQIADLSGLENFVGLEKGLDVHSNYIKIIDTIIDLQEEKDAQEQQLQERFKTKVEQLKVRVEEFNTAKTNLEKAEEAKKAAEEAVNKANSAETVPENLPELQEALEKANREVATARNILNVAQTAVTNKVKELYTIYNDAYRVTSAITPELRNMPDAEYSKLSFEAAKALFEAQVAKIKSIEKYLTAEEKTTAKVFLSSTLDFTDEKATPISTYYDELVKRLADSDSTTAHNYTAELYRLRKFDAYITAGNSCLIYNFVNNSSDCQKEKAHAEEKALKEKDYEETSAEILDVGEHSSCSYTNDDVIAIAHRITLASEEDIAAYVVLPRLHALNMSENLIENIDEIGIMKELRELKMADNEIASLENVAWTNISWLNTVDLSFNNISDIKILEAVKKLRNLNVAKNLISGSFTFDMTKIDLEHLEKLDLSNNQIDDMEALKNQFEFIAKNAGYDNVVEYIKEKFFDTAKINLKEQQLSMSLRVQKTGDRIKVELPKIFRQFEELDWRNTSFGVTSLTGNVTSDGKYVLLETPMIGTRIATVSVSGGIGNGTSCSIQYEVVSDSGSGEEDKDEDKDNVIININTGDGSSVKAVKEMNKMNYIIVTKGTKVSDVLKDVTTESHEIVIKDANAKETMNFATALQTNQTVVVDGVSNEAQCKIVVTGDVTGNGEIGLGDILKLNEYRLDNANVLTDAEFIAGNVMDSDEEINLSDILALNQYRLNQE